MSYLNDFAVTVTNQVSLLADKTVYTQTNMQNPGWCGTSPLVPCEASADETAQQLPAEAILLVNNTTSGPRLHPNLQTL